MATRTPNYGLSKPLGTEDAQISVINANMDILDTELHLTTVRDAKNLASIYDATSSYVEGDYVTYLITGQSSQDANGYFVFKCIDDTTEPAGNFDTTKWEAVCITDEMGSGGGGGGEGGHIFLDNAGTAMPQRAKAKFEGAYSTDNSTDGITNVAVFRTMKAMAYAQLTEEEKQGMIYVDDETTGTDDKFQPVIYSTEEREIGVWTDGKPLYQKTWDFGSDISISNSSFGTISGLSIPNVETFVNSFGIKSSGDYQGSILLFYDSSSDTIKGQTARNSASLVQYLTVQYTKSTDTAGSGQWTPQGVPAVHYSTDEHIIGTWIDGSTVYEKTFHTGALSSTGSIDFIHNISNFGKFISAIGQVEYGSYITTFPTISTSNWGYQLKFHNIDSTKFTLYVGSSFTGQNAVTDSYVTIRYTKSS